MADEVKLTRAVLQAQVDKLRKQYHVLGEEIIAIELLLAGQKTPAQEAQGLLKDFGACWATVHTGVYLPNFAKDVPALKRLVLKLGAPEVRARITRYLASKDPFYVDARHPLAMFVAAVNKFAAAGELELASAPVDCRHTPPCRTDAEHTRRATQERRAAS